MKIISSVSTVLLFYLIFVGAAKSQTSNSNFPIQNIEEKIYKIEDVDQKAEITKLPKIRITGECGTEKNSSGRVTLEIVLHKSGKVTQANLIEKSECGYFNNRALELAKKIKFKPALKDGKAVSQYRRASFEYNFFVIKDR